MEECNFIVFHSIGRELVLFIKEFEKAAKVLEDYGIKFYKVSYDLI